MRRHLEIGGGEVVALRRTGDGRCSRSRRSAAPRPTGRTAAWSDGIAPLLDAGRVKLYCVTSYDAASWHDESLSLEERARRHQVYERWITDDVAPWIHADCGGDVEIALAGCSFGAYHAANFALRRADLFPLAICMSGVYDVSVVGGGGSAGDAVYFQNPMDYVAHLQGDHLDWLRSRVSLLLVCGQGQWEDTTGALE